MKKFFIWFYLFSISFIYSNAQNHKLKFFSTEMGLSSSEVYCIAQDNKGYMWFGTSRGLSMFDGVMFKNFSSKDGLPSNSIIKIFKDRFGRLWFSAFDGTLSYYFNNKFFTFDKNDTLQKIDKNYHITNLFFDNDSNMWFTPAQGGIYYFDKQNNVHQIQPQIKHTGLYIFKKDNYFLSQYISSKAADSVFFEKTDSTLLLFAFRQGFRYNNFIVDDSTLFVSLANELYFIQNNKIVLKKRFDSEITNILVDKSKNVWVGIMQEGVYVFSNYNFSKPTRHLLEGMTVSAVFQDIQNGFWLPTTENSIFYSPSFDFNYFTIPSEKFTNITSLKPFNNSLFVSNYNKNLYQVSIDQNYLSETKKIDFSKNPNYTINDIVVTNDNIVWLIGKELIKIKDGKFTNICRLSRSYKAYSKDNKIYISSDRELKIVSDTSFEIITHNLNIIVNSIYVDDAQNVWFGTINGLYVYSLSKFQYFGNSNPVFKSRINDITGFNNLIVVATNGSGIYFFNPQNNYLSIITETNGLTSNFVNSLLSMENEIWVGTNRGLCKVNLISDTEPIKTFIVPFNESDGLFSYEIKDIEKYNNTIFIGTSDGIYYFDKYKIKKNLNPPILMLDSIIVNNKSLKIQNNYRFKPSQNTISFFYKAISYTAGNKIVYKYKLEGYDNQWNFTKDQFLRFPNLPSNKYKLIVYASTDGMNWTPEPIIVDFSIKKKFSQTLFFYILIILLITFISMFFISYRYHRLRQDLRMRRLTIRSEQKALRSQMNPHFIFNALNSIRRYILDSSTDKADFYLTRFAQLMRQVLENSKKEYISLEEEINTMRLYLELERMRFDNTFVFTIDVDININQKTIFLPTMIIQPVVENAIWHGLAPLQSNGLLNLSFKSLNDKSFECIIDDNGIGRQKAKDIAQRRKGHKSTGITNLQERIELINQTGLKFIEMETIDKYDQQNNPNGTKVIIKFWHKSNQQSAYSKFEKFLIKINILKK